MTSMQSPGAYNTQPPTSDDEEFCFTSKRPEGRPELVHLQHSSCFRQFSYGSVSSDNDDACFIDALEQPQCPFEDDLGSHGSPQPSVGEQLSRARQGSIVDGLLHEIYDRWHYSRHDSIDSDTMTECSSTSEFFFHSRHEAGGYHSAIERRHGGQLNRSFLQNQSCVQLKRMLFDLQRSVSVMNVRLVRQLKRRDRRQAKLQRNFDIVTAVLQAASLKRQIDTRMKFSIQPPPGQSAFEQWRDAMKAVCRLPLGIPTEFRKKVWLSLADHYLFQLKINWEKTVRFVFNERSNPDDDKLGMQIVKDLHRTGCSNFSGEENDEDRAVLKRLLLAYARWNKRVGYCQGFNVIAALLLNVMDRKEDDALKVMIYLIDSVLPESYFANNLRALSVDMAVFRDLLRYTYPRLSKHLDRLQLAAQDIRTGACYEPPLTNVFTMQWFLTLFATCLPVEIVLRVWDSILLEGSEILLRTALTIWGKLAKRIMGASSADEFYSLMGELSSSIMQGSLFDGDTMVKSVYSFGDFPFPHLHELREKYTYNIRPFTPASAAGGGGGAKKSSGPRGAFKSLFNSDDDELDDDDIAAMACMPGEMSNSASDISVLGPGVYGPGGEEASSKASPQLERMNTDIHSLKLQYQRLKQRQQQAHIIIAAASAKKSRAAGSHRLGPPGAPGPVLVPNIESPTAMNHLFVGKASSSARNRLVTDGPRISAPMVSQHNQGLLAKQLQAVANAKAVSKSKRMRTGISSHSAAPNPRAGSPSDWSDGQEIPSSPTRDGRLDSCAEADDVEVSLAHSSSCETVTEQPRERKTTESSSTLSNSPKSSDLISLASDASFAPAADFTQEKSAVVTSSGDFSEPVCEKIVKKSLTNQTSDPVHPKPVYTSDDSCSTQIRSAHVSEASESHASTLSGSDSESPVFASEGEALESSIQVLVTEKTGAAVIGDDADNFLGDTLEHKSMTASLDAVRDDSGVDSPSSNSPMLSPGKRLGDTPHLTDSTAHVSSREVDIILAMERRTSTQNVIGSCEQISLSEVEDIRVSLVRPETENAAVRIPCGTDDQLCLSGDHGEESSLAAVLSVEVQDVKSNTCSDYRSTDSVAIDGLDSRSSSVSAVDFSDRSGTSIATDSGSKVKVDRQVSSSSTDSAVEVARLLDATAVTSPPRAVRSASVVETVPVPETVDVGTTERTSAAPDATRHKAMTNSRRDKDSHQGYSKPRRSSQPVVRRVGHQTMVVAHKPSMESSDGQRLSPSSGMDREGERSPGSSTTFPTLLKKSQRPFNPFPVKHFNANRAKTGLKLGLYSASTIDQLRGLKTRTTSS